MYDINICYSFNNFYNNNNKFFYELSYIFIKQ